MKIKYSPDASDCMREINANYGKKRVTIIRDAIHATIDNPEIYPSVEKMIGVPSPYRFIHVSEHYVFYRIGTNEIFVTDIYHEREDFMWKLFGIRLRTDESIDFWGE